ncbi:MAG: cell division protein FtsL [Clostridiaceae bacterium]|nr:cell division protein FtsL [Clostridiaceae bacterium]
MERSNGYVYGSAAPKMPVEPQRRAGKRVVRKVYSKPLPSRSSIPKVQMIFCIVFMVAVSFLILYRYAAISELNYRMGQLTEEYNRLRDENRALNVEIETSINLDYVKEFAETRLNMHKPDSYQIVTVSVPKSDYSVVVDQSYIDDATENTSLIGNIVKLFKAILQ